MKILAEALKYVHRGWYIIPLYGIVNGKCTCGSQSCTKQGKHPIIKNWPRLASNDPQIVNQWWKKHPQANVGILTGIESGFFVLDVDPQHGGKESLKKLINEYGDLPKTVQTLTGGGGYHFFFKCLHKHIRNKQNFMPGLDIRANGGYIVAPSSKHISGKNYLWNSSSLPDVTPLADPPSWLLKKVSEKRKIKYNASKKRNPQQKIKNQTPKVYKKNSPDTKRPSEHNLFKDYINTFVQRQPGYTIKNIDEWKYKNKPLSDPLIDAHLQGKYAIGGLGKWYPEYAVLDYDNVSMKYVDQTRKRLNFNNENSMLLTSESKNSYHLFFKPLYKNKPPTIKLLHLILDSFCKQNDIELYPHPRHTLRLPFAPYQKCVDVEHTQLNHWHQKFQRFKELDELELSEINNLLMENFNLNNSNKPKHYKGTYAEGKELYKSGLQSASSRNDSQFKVIYYLFRNNWPLNRTIKEVVDWIKNKHNGFSKEIKNEKYKIVFDEIKRQAKFVYFYYDSIDYYPDSTHNTYNGYITKPDINEIVRITQGSKPRMKFLFNIIKYFYPRRFRPFINIHSNKLIHWSSNTTYQKYLDEMSNIINRKNSYYTDTFSKSLRLKWDFKDSDKAILFDGRSVDTFGEAVQFVFDKPRDFREILESSGCKRTTSIEIVRSLWDVN